MPLSNLYRIAIVSIRMESLSDSILRVAYKSSMLKAESNKINLFPNIKLIARSVVRIWLQSNLISDVPCTALDQMEKLEYLNLDQNVITYLCPMLITQATKLATLILNNNQLLEVADVRGPTRMQPTRVWLKRNPLRCLASMCWMLFVAEDSNLQLGLQCIECLDAVDIWTDMTAGLTVECACKFIYPLLEWSNYRPPICCLSHAYLSPKEFTKDTP